MQTPIPIRQALGPAEAMFVLVEGMPPEVTTYVLAAKSEVRPTAKSTRQQTAFRPA